MEGTDPVCFRGLYKKITCRIVSKKQSMDLAFLKLLLGLSLEEGSKTNPKVMWTPSEGTENQQQVCSTVVSILGSMSAISIPVFGIW